MFEDEPSLSVEEKFIASIAVSGIATIVVFGCAAVFWSARLLFLGLDTTILTAALIAVLLFYQYNNSRNN
jgi:hypothetical protein